MASKNFLKFELDTNSLNKINGGFGGSSGDGFVSFLGGGSGGEGIVLGGGSGGEGIIIVNPLGIRRGGGSGGEG